jgi:hypothetical protein
MAGVIIIDPGDGSCPCGVATASIEYWTDEFAGYGYDDIPMWDKVYHYITYTECQDPCPPPRPSVSTSDTCTPADCCKDPEQCNPASCFLSGPVGCTGSCEPYLSSILLIKTSTRVAFASNELSINSASAEPRLL